MHGSNASYSSRINPMTVWQVDCYRRPLQTATGELLWELLICTADSPWQYRATCPQSAVTPAWLLAELQTAIAQVGKPQELQVFRPQTLNLLEAIATQLDLTLTPTRHTPVLKQQLEQDARTYADHPDFNGDSIDLLTIEQLAPNPIPDHVLGERWRFVGLSAGDFTEAFGDEPMPYLNLPDALMPLDLGLPSTTMIPGVVIYGGRRSLPLATWLQEVTPMSLSYIPGEPDGLILSAGLCDRWVLATFDDASVRPAAQVFEERKARSQGIHFLLVQPDDSGMTSTGIWLLRA